MRKFETVRTEVKLKWPTKGKSAKANEGEFNLLSLAFELRVANIILSVVLSLVSSRIAPPSVDALVANPPTMYFVQQI